MARRHTPGTVPVFALFFLSGIAALVYEVVWTRFLVLFVGNTARANAVVLATFMGGLALGYHLFGRRADEMARRAGGRGLLGLYARLEATIGLYGLLFPSLMRALAWLFVAAARPLGPDSALLLPLSLALATSALALPAIMMGGTLPVLVAWATRREGSLGEEVSRLYALNSGGAVVGALLAGFVLVEKLGQRGTVRAAAVANLVLAAAALALARREPAAEIERALEAPARPAPPAPAIAWLPSLAAAASGFAALLLEVVWIRLFAVVFGSSTQSFTVIVAAFVAGITTGAALARRLCASSASRARTQRWLVGAAAAAALCVVIVEPAYASLPWLLGKLRVHYGAAHAFYRFSAAKFYLCALVMIVPTVLSGLLLPLATHLGGRGEGRQGRDVGRVFAWNGVGSVVGAALGGTVLVPLVGLRGTLLIGILAYAAIAVAALLVDGLGAARLAGAAALVALLVVGSLAGSRWDSRTLDAGEFRRGATMPAFAAWLAEQHRPELTFHEDGATCTVDVMTLPDKKRYLKVNGKTDASNWGDVLTAAGTPAVGALLADRLESAMVIGFGSGVTATTLLKFGIPTVDAVEIEPAVLRAARLFPDVNDNCLDDPRLHTHLADARTWLMLAERRYDVIVNEPSNPWVAGVSSLFTREFFEVVRDHLEPGGSYVQWFHLYDMDDEMMRLILRTVSTVFPYTTIWQFDNDIAIVARATPFDHDLAEMARRFALPEVRRYFDKLGVYDLFSLLSTQIASEGAARVLGGDGPVHEDDRPVLEYHSPRAQFDRAYSFLLARGDERRHLDRDSRLMFVDRIRRALPSLDEAIDFTLLHAAQPRTPEAFRYRYLDRVLAESKEAFTFARLVTTYEKLARVLADADRVRCYREADRSLAALERLEPTAPRTTWLRAVARARRVGTGAATDAVLAELLGICNRAPAADRYRGNCRDLAHGLGIALGD